MAAGRDNHEPLRFNYTFKFPDGKIKSFNAVVDRKTLKLVAPQKPSSPEWAKLTNNKCSNCTLTESDESYCPVAVNINEIIEYFTSSVSHDKVDIIVETNDRVYSRAARVEDGISSLIGIYMVTSSCPVLEKLAPMVRFHMPFATLEETRYRALSMYLTAQYIVYKNGGNPDWDMNKLLAIYEGIRAANKSFSQRLKGVIKNDANANALVKLDCFAMNLTFVIDKEMMGPIEELFEVYTRGASPSDYTD